LVAFVSHISRLVIITVMTYLVTYAFRRTRYGASMSQLDQD
jgi:hypothetical protein